MQGLPNVQYESSRDNDEDSNEGDEPSPVHIARAREREIARNKLPVMYNFRVHTDYIRARIRWRNATLRRITAADGSALSDVDAAGAALSQIKSTGSVVSVSSVRKYTRLTAILSRRAVDGPFQVLEKARQDLSI